jgi:hypothetical protein
VAIIPAEFSAAPFVPDAVQRAIDGLLGIKEIDTEALYRILSFEQAEAPEELGLGGLFRALEWVKEEGETLPRVRVRNAQTGEELVVPSILLEKLSPLESLGEQAE